MRRRPSDSDRGTGRSWVRLLVQSEVRLRDRQIPSDAVVLWLRSSASRRGSSASAGCRGAQPVGKNHRQLRRCSFAAWARCQADTASLSRPAAA